MKFITNVISRVLTLLLAFIFLSGQSQTSRGKEADELILDWNLLTYQIAYEHDQFYSFKGVRTLTMVHLAIHDVLNLIDPQFETYLDYKVSAKVSPIIAASQAAYEILLAAYPNREDTLSVILNHWLDQFPTESQKEAGIELGKLVASKLIQTLQGDGHEKQGDYTPMTKPGDYQYTPGWDGWVLKPDFDYAKPFCLEHVTQFRSPPPPALNSEAYAASYNEVKRYGKKNSEVRSQDQTHFAHWWAEFAEHSWNRLGRITAREQSLSLHETARMFALINMDIYDIYIASLESKYHYDTWRPYTAIRASDTDGNIATEPDTSWEPEMLTPPWPEYPSAHAAVGSGGAEIMTYVFGTPQIGFTMESTSALPDNPKRSYQNLNDAADQCAESRIMNGYHFRFATDEGMNQGKAIARHIHQNFLRPL